MIPVALNQRQITLLEKIEQKTGYKLPRRADGTIDPKRLAEWIEGIVRCLKAMLEAFKLVRQLIREFKDWLNERKQQQEN